MALMAKMKLPWSVVRQRSDTATIEAPSYEVAYDVYRDDADFIVALVNALADGTLATLFAGDGGGWNAGAHAMREVAECMVAEAINRIEERIMQAETSGLEKIRYLQHTSGALMQLQADIKKRPLPSPPLARPAPEPEGGQ